MTILSPTVTSTPINRKPSFRVKCRSTYQGRSVDNNTFSTESSIGEQNSDDSEYHFDAKRRTTEEVRNHSRMRVFQNRSIMKFVLGFLIGGIIGYNIPLQAVFQDLPFKKDAKFSLRDLRSKYASVRSSVFDELESAVTLIHRKGAPLSFVLAHRGNENVHEITLDVATLASKFLGNGTVFIIKLDSLDTNVEADYGKLLTRWRADIEGSHVIVVPNLQQIPEHLAPVFHTLCDEFTPYVYRSLYLHTVDVGSASTAVERPGCEDCATVERLLRQSWPAMANEVFEPLLARIAGTVLTV